MWHGYATRLIHKWYVTMQLTTGPCTARIRIYVASALICDMSNSYVMFQNAVYYRPSRSSHTHVYDMAHWCLTWLIRTWYVTILFTTGPRAARIRTALRWGTSLWILGISNLGSVMPMSTRCIAECGRVLRWGAQCCSVLQCVAVCCSVLQCGAVCCSGVQSGVVCFSVL